MGLPELSPGDYNANLLVEQADLDLVLLHWGTELTNPAAVGWIHDVPTGLIDQDELDRVLLNWGQSAVSPVATTAGVPEPTSAGLALIGCVAAILFARRRQRT